MKMNYNYILCVLFILFFLQCKNQDDSTDAYFPPVFPETQEVVTKRLNDSFIFDTGLINFIDTFIICSGKTDINEHPFHLFSKKSGDHVRSFGQIGQGPGEIILPVSGFSTDRNQNKVFFYDTRQFKLTEYSLYYTENEIAVNTKDYMLPPEIRNVRSEMFFSLGNNEFLSAYNNSYDTSYRFIKTNIDDTISTYNQYPKLNEPEEFVRVEHAYFANLGRFATKTDGKKFAHATQGGCILEIFDCSDRITLLQTKRFFEPVYIPPKRKDTMYPFVQVDPNSIHGITSIACTDKYIYTIYSDRRGENEYHQIAAFDWYGDPVKLFSFERGIISFVIEDNDKKGYALMRDPDHDVSLVSFDL
ncbi:6-bladed beta-propeller [Proteiniphilum sp. X52]|nr:6-bladed beta-propeller [Proteiniphilum sp. X52]